MLINFNNIDIAINGSGITSTNSSINTSNSIEAAYILGYSRPINQLPAGSIKTTFNSTYFPIISQEPNYAIVDKLKNMIIDTGYMGERIEFAGLHHDYWFMDNYGFKLQPSNIVESNISYSTYWELCGDIRGKSNNIEYLNSGDFSHSWTTKLSGINDIYDLSYDCKINWQPIYIIGKKFPVEVKLLNIAEALSFSMDDYRSILFTGENVYPSLSNDTNGNFTFNNLNILCSGCNDTGVKPILTLNISGFKIKSINPVAQVGQFFRVNYVANRYY